MLRFAFAWSAIASAGFATGCGDTVTGDYKTYAELDGRSEVGTRTSEREDRNIAASISEPPPANSQPSTLDSQPEDPGTSTAGDPDVPVRPGTTVEPGEPRPMADPRQQPPATAGRKVRLLVKDRTFKVEGPQNAIRVSYDDIDLLKVLDMEPVTPEAPGLMPDWLKRLDGKRIRIRGFMYPPPLETGIEAFALARDNQICCFGKNPKIYDVFPVFLQEGVTTDYILNRPFDVVGVFHINPAVEDGQLQRLYEMDDAVVIDKQR